MRNYGLLSFSAFLALTLSFSGLQRDFPVLRGPYLGQKPPGTTPVLFATGIVSTGLSERDVAVGSDGREIYYGLTLGPITTIMVSREREGRWTEPETASFASNPAFMHFEPALAHGGGKILFLSNRPPRGREVKPGWQYQNIWASDRSDEGGWSEPFELESGINTDDFEFFPSVTRQGTLYFTRSKPGDLKTTIYRSRLAGGKYLPPEPLPSQINGRQDAYNACISPDESYLVACVAGKRDGAGPATPNYQVFFRDADDSWSEGIPLGAEINRPGARASSPALSPDGRFFFFASDARTQRDGAATERLSYARLLELHNSPGNGNSDIYWVDAELIRRLRPEN